MASASDTGPADFADDRVDQSAAPDATPDSGIDGFDSGAIEEDAGEDMGFEPRDTGPTPDMSTAGGSVRFFGQGGLRGDRIRWRLDDPARSDDPGPALDVGAGDFTIEFWIRGRLADNPNSAVNCGANNNWITGNIVVDRDRHDQSPAWGMSLGIGRFAFGMLVDNVGLTICATTTVLDDDWHHVAFQRSASNGLMQIWVDGSLDASGTGPTGDASYPDDGVPRSVCPDTTNGGSCDYSDPFLVLGAEKHGYGGISFNGFIDELRVSNNLRYSTLFTPPQTPFTVDAETVGLYHFDESGDVAVDSTGAVDGEFIYGGNPQGPQRSGDSPF